MKPVDPLLTIREVAANLKVSIATVNRRVADGTLPKPLKLGRLSRWAQSEILAAVAAARDRRAA
jgi:excisionase family DNA binding protein